MIWDKTGNLRADLEQVIKSIAPKSRVLDVGCGDGAILDYLQTEKQCSVYGVEIEHSQVLRCVERGVSVIQKNCEEGLSLFSDQSFDTVLCLSALQTMRHIRELLIEMARVGKQVIVSLPNFAYWRHRLALLSGHMPSSESLPYHWYDSPNLRYTTLDDFVELAKELGFDTIDVIALNDAQPVRVLKNWRAQFMIFYLSRSL